VRGKRVDSRQLIKSESDFATDQLYLSSFVAPLSLPHDDKSSIHIHAIAVHPTSQYEST